MWKFIKEETIRLFKDEGGWILPAIGLGLQAYQAFKGGGKVSQEPMLTPQQQEAMNLLLQFGKTGQYGGYQAGAGYGGALGAYGMTGLEKAGQTKLGEMITGGLPKGFQLGQEEYRKLLETDYYDPTKEGLYKRAKTGIRRAAGEEADIFAREGAKTGRLASTWMGKELGLLGERTHGKLADILAELSYKYQERRLTGATEAARLGVQEEGLKMGRIGAAYQYGALERMLKDAQAKEKYAEWLRGRGEKQSQIDALARVVGANVPYGVKTMPVANPYLDLLDKAIKGGTEWIGSYFQQQPSNRPKYVSEEEMYPKEYYT